MDLRDDNTYSYDFDELEDRSLEDQMSDADDESFMRWAERYDELNGAPENEEDR